jgi:hypothetical protein
MAEIDVATIPPDTVLAEELSDDIVAEMANLTAAQPGIDGTIFISTSMGAHGPRVKYFLQPGRSEPSFSVSISDKPAVVTNSPARKCRPPDVAARRRMGIAEQGRLARFLGSRRHLDAAEGQ